MSDKLFLLISICIFFILTSCSNDPTSSNGEPETGEVTDIDGNIYKTVKIGDQWWMAENLKVTHFRNSHVISEVFDNSDWSSLNIPFMAIYNNENSNISTYGALYNWYAVHDSRMIAPEGWHIPTDEEWKELEMHLGMTSEEANGEFRFRGTNEGGKMKETGTDHWKEPNEGATNSSKLSILPGGYRFDNGHYTNLYYSSQFWTSTNAVSDSSWIRYIYFNDARIGRIKRNNHFGYSVRCIKD